MVNSPELKVSKGSCCLFYIPLSLLYNGPDGKVLEKEIIELSGMNEAIMEIKQKESRRDYMSQDAVFLDLVFYSHHIRLDSS